LIFIDGLYCDPILGFIVCQYVFIVICLLQLHGLRGIMRRFDLFSSQFVIQESSAGDAAVAQTRLQLLSDISLVQVNVDCASLARALVERGPIPEKAAVDALHIAIATVHGMDYLLTWNCKHIANAEMQTAVKRICRSAGYEPPVICTPEELSGD
jgi:hypothetical protein